DGRATESDTRFEGQGPPGRPATLARAGGAGGLVARQADADRREAVPPGWWAEVERDRRALPGREHAGGAPSRRCCRHRHPANSADETLPGTSAALPLPRTLRACARTNGCGFPPPASR